MTNKQLSIYDLLEIDGHRVVWLHEQGEKEGILWESYQPYPVLRSTSKSFVVPCAALAPGVTPDKEKRAYVGREGTHGYEGFYLSLNRRGDWPEYHSVFYLRPPSGQGFSRQGYGVYREDITRKRQLKHLSQDVDDLVHSLTRSYAQITGPGMEVVNANLERWRAEYQQELEYLTTILALPD